MLLILPSSNAKIKRCFSYIYHVKTDEVVLNNQMQICADEPKIEDFSSASSLKVYFFGM